MSSVRADQNTRVMLEIFRAIERRDLQAIIDRCHPDVEFHWPPPLPYAGVSHGPGDRRPNWADTWIPLQPGPAEQAMDPRVVGATDDEVVILWRQRGASPAGERCDSPVLALYRLRAGKLARAEMFYFDPVAVSGFLREAARD
jgi:ketosteroid isomerase-like protein